MSSAKVLSLFIYVFIFSKAFCQPCFDPSVCWNYVSTSSIHTIIIPSSANPSINGAPLPNGTFIGIFFNDAGALKCGGYGSWNGSNIAITAYGDDGSTIEKDGFIYGEAFNFKYLLPTGELVDNISTIFETPPGPFPGILTAYNSYTANGISQLATLAGTLVSTDYQCSSPEAIIADTLPPIEDSILISRSRASYVTNLDLLVDLSHTFTGDLIIMLRSPSGITATLYNQFCEDDQDIKATFDDDGNALTCPVIGYEHVQPENALSIFNGESINGVWKLTVIDGFGDDAGVLHHWCLIPMLAECLTNANCDDGNACTDDVCIAGLCSNLLICDDSDTCTFDFCDNGCKHINLCCLIDDDCDDFDECTDDGCDNNACVSRSKDCYDADPCTTDGCMDGICTHETLCADDGDPCTIDCFDGGCLYSPRCADDLNICTDDCSEGSCLYDPIDCNDHDVCTIDACNPQTGCTHDAIDCDDFNACTTDSCDMQTGCTYVTIICDDNSLCTTDGCDTASGCITNSIICDDGAACTTDGCDPFTGCTTDPTICDDWNACTTDECNPLLGCTTIPIVCDDHDICTTDGCDTTTGCITNPIICDDANACTIDECNQLTGCITNLILCDDGDACTTDGCNPIIGCTTNPITCDDGDACTNDGCDPIIGCTTNPITCDDGDACTSDECDLIIGCITNPITCDDGDACTADQCNPLLGCTTIPIVCDDQDICTLDGCKPLTGCTITPITCDDGNACTADGCDPITACTANPIICDDGDPCTTDLCDSQIGCQFTMKKPELAFDYQNSCAGDSTHITNLSSGIEAEAIYHLDIGSDWGIDYSIPATALPIDSAVVIPLIGNIDFTIIVVNPGGCSDTLVASILLLSCDDDDACTIDSCGSLQCFHTVVNCNDDDACSIDDCNSQDGCAYSNFNCDDQNECTIDHCDNITGCFSRAINCNDFSLCTNDHCDPASGCVYTTAIDCNDFNVCTVDSCSATDGCVPYLRSCDDNNVCTFDFCYTSSGCINSEINCNDFNACTDDECDSINGCFIKAIDCNDNSACTIDNCSPQSGCNYTQVNCNDFNACTVDSCSVADGCHQSIIDCDDHDNCTIDDCDPSSGCVHIPIVCSDQDLCTADRCDKTLQCVFIPIACNDNDLCTTDKCEFGVCVHLSVNCNDGDLCTTDECVGGSCVFLPNNCNDGDPCSDEVCIPGTGCVFTPHDCNDNDLCTDERCVPRLGCAYTSHDCDDNNACTTDICTSEDGCAHTILYCDDSDNCTIDLCLNGRCLNNLIDCSDADSCTLDECASGICLHTSIPGCPDEPIPCAADTRKVVSLTLIDALRNVDIGILSDGDIVDLSITGYINVRADVCLENNIESVKFLVNGAQERLENIPVYSIAGDNNGSYSSWNIQPGVYIIKAVPYSGDNATGITGAFHQVTITIIDGQPLCQGNERVVTSLTLVNAFNNMDIGPLFDGQVIDLDITGPISIRANVCHDNNIESVKFLVNGNSSIIENIPVYTIAGDNNGNYNPWNIPPGVYTIRAIPYSGNNATGIAGTFAEVTITVINAPPCQNGERKVVSLSLVNADTDQDIKLLADGEEIDLNLTGPINIRANVCHETNIKSVKFLVNGNFYRMENIAVYTIAGDNNGNYSPWNVQPGTYTVTAIPYSGTNGTGITGTSHQVTITIIHSTPKMDLDETLANNPIENGTILKAYPNPFMDELHIEFRLPEDNQVKLEIFNISGQKIFALFEGYVKSSEIIRLKYSPANFSDGMIIYRLRTEQGTYYDKALMIR